ncbi:MAG: hypothetical protein J5965_10075 [Aeriscardovia sp.]|nr:hypothetical protein [Aeriscardovia sp.]
MDDYKPPMTMNIALCATQVKLRQFERVYHDLMEELDALYKKRDELEDKADELHSIIVMMRDVVEDYEKADETLKSLFS